MALHLKLRSRHSHILTIRLLSNSSSPFPPPPPPSTSSDEPSPESQSQSQSQQSSFSSFFRSSPSPPRRIPFNPPPPATLSDTTSSSFDDIRKKLSSYRQSAPSSATSSSPNISFQELLRNNPSGSDSKVLPFNSIRESLRQRPSQGQNDPLNLSSLQETLRSHLAEGNSGQSSLFGSGGSLPDSIFGREAKGLKKEDGDDNSLKTEFLKSYTEAELGEKLRKLRPEESEKKGFSLTEMNERLAKLRKLEKDSTIYGLSSSDFRESLVSLTQDNDKKKNFQRLSILANIGGLTTPSFMLKPPQDELLEKFFHPDHMSSAEKMKIELKRVRDEFKMSDSDCGSARVQVAQLTTKIKHLSGALHKKDKHSKKGLQEMVQRRKKLLKYLRRTDWDSYCLVLSKLGLRDVPEFKVPDYKKTQSKSKSKSKSKKKKMKA